MTGQIGVLATCTPKRTWMVVFRTPNANDEDQWDVANVEFCTSVAISLHPVARMSRYPSICCNNAAS